MKEMSKLGLFNWKYVSFIRSHLFLISFLKWVIHNLLTYKERQLEKTAAFDSEQNLHSEKRELELKKEKLQMLRK